MTFANPWFIAAVLGVKPENMRGTWVRGPGSYGRGDAGDAANAAAILSKAVGKPVRYQAQRHEAHGWDPKGPASIHTIRAGVDKSGKVVAWSFNSKGFDRLNVESNESKPQDNLFSQLAGVAPKPNLTYGSPQESYTFPAKQLTWEVIPPLLESGSPLRTSHLRDPLGPDIHFASESFVDEMAFSVGMDPVEFRLGLLEKHKDYKERAKAFHAKEKRIATLHAAIDARCDDLEAGLTRVEATKVSALERELVAVDAALERWRSETRPLRDSRAWTRARARAGVSSAPSTWSMNSDVQSITSCGWLAWIQWPASASRRHRFGTHCGRSSQISATMNLSLRGTISCTGISVRRSPGFSRRLAKLARYRFTPLAPSLRWLSLASGRTPSSFSSRPGHSLSRPAFHRVGATAGRWNMPTYQEWAICRATWRRASPSS